MTDEEFYRHALEVLQRELGADGLARFLRLMRSGSGDYTRDRELLLKDVRIADILESIQSYRGKEPPTSTAKATGR